MMKLALILNLVGHYGTRKERLSQFEATWQ